MAESIRTGALAEVLVRTSGDVAASDRRYAVEKVGRARELVRGPTLGMRVDLVAHADPARERPAFAKAEVDLYLFHNEETGEDNVVFRSELGGYELLEPAATCSLADPSVPIRHSAVRPPTVPLPEAVDLLELASVPFVFFLDPVDGLGRVLYHRYDGHLGLITPASP